MNIDWVVRLVGGLVLVSSPVVVQTAAHASLEGNHCTFGIGSGYPAMCVSKDGDAAELRQARSIYYGSQLPVKEIIFGDTVCRRSHEIIYVKPSGESGKKEESPSSCVPAVMVSLQGDYTDWFPPDPRSAVKPDSQICARAKNSATHDEWNSYACVTVGT